MSTYWVKYQCIIRCCFFTRFVSLRPYLIVWICVCHKKVTQLDTVFKKLCSNWIAFEFEMFSNWMYNKRLKKQSDIFVKKKKKCLLAMSQCFTYKRYAFNRYKLPTCQWACNHIFVMNCWMCKVLCIRIYKIKRIDIMQYLSYGIIHLKPVIYLILIWYTIIECSFYKL